MGRSSSLISSQKTLATTPAFQQMASWRHLQPPHSSQWNVMVYTSNTWTFNLKYLTAGLPRCVFLWIIPPLFFINTDPARVARMPRQTYLPAGMGGVIICPVQADPPVLYVNWTKDGNDLNLDNVSTKWRNESRTINKYLLLAKPPLFLLESPPVPRLDGQLRGLSFHYNSQWQCSWNVHMYTVQQLRDVGALSTHPSHPAGEDHKLKSLLWKKKYRLPRAKVKCICMSSRTHRYSKCALVLSISRRWAGSWSFPVKPVETPLRMLRGAR